MERDSSNVCVAPENSKSIIDSSEKEETDKSKENILSCEVEMPESSTNELKYGINNIGATDNQTEETEVSVKDKSLLNGYRDDSDSCSEDDASSTTHSSDSSSESDTFFDALHESNSGPKKISVVKTKGELDLDDLPKIEDLKIAVSEEEIEKIGWIHAIVDRLVVIHSFKDSKPLDLDTVLFLSPNQPLGRVFDVFGPVIEPFYSIRFNSVDDIKEKDIKTNADVFYAPKKSDLTSYVFVNDLQNQKGSDASWKHNNEPPDKFLDFSDDEQEKAVKRKHYVKNRNAAINNYESSRKRSYIEERRSDYATYASTPRRAFSRNAEHVQYLRPNSFCQQPIYRPTQQPPLFPMRSPAPSPSLNIPRPNFAQPPLSIVSSPPPFLFQQQQQNVLQRPPQPPLTIVSSPPPFQFQPQNVIPRPSQSPLSVISSPPPFQFQPQNVLQRPPQSPFLFTSYHSPPVFGQAPTLGPVSPALHTPISFHSPLVNNVPTLVSAQPLSLPNSQTLFGQEFQQNFSPAFQSSPVSSDPWLPNRSPLYGATNVAPSAPLTVQIPPNFSPSPQPRHLLDHAQYLPPFQNQQTLNFPNGFATPRFQ